MASLMEDLIFVLGEENAEYHLLLELSRKKKPVIINGDIDQLQEITEDEQNIIDRITHLEKQRRQCMSDIANVINRDVETLKLENLITMLEKRPEEQKKLEDVRMNLRETVNLVSDINEQNRILLESARDIVEFNLSVYQASKRAPETANYNRSAFNAGSIMGTDAGYFDVKQ